MFAASGSEFDSDHLPICGPWDGKTCEGAACGKTMGVGLLLDPSALMTARVAGWLARVPPASPVYMPEAVEQLVGKPSWPALGLFCGQGTWASNRRLCAGAQPLGAGSRAGSMTFARICQPPISNRSPASAHSSSEPHVPPQDAGLDRLVAAQLWAGMAEGMWLVARRPPVFEALAAAGLLVVTTSSGAAQAWGRVLAAHSSSLGPYLVGALSRRVRYLARVVARPAADDIVELLGAEGSVFPLDWPATELESPVIEVFDAGPPMRGGPWR